jgi:acetylornithine deacetylase/succinyl-diaminopimelate desuccinylase-like protein
MDRLRELDPLLALLIEPTLGVSVAPTQVRASEKINVIPAQAELRLDCRVPPGLGEQDARRRLEEVLGADGYRLEFTERVIGNRSPMRSPLMDEIGAWISEQDPGARLVPMMLPGFTDSRWFREAFPECVAYGFFPQRAMTRWDTTPLIHAPDERIAIGDIEFAARFFNELAPAVLR